MTLTQTSTDVSASSYPNSTVSTAFTVVDAAPVLSIAGGTSQTIPPNSAFVLDLSGSYDPACPPTSSPEITYFISVQSEPPLSIEIPSNMTESTYTIPADSISGSATLTITMTSTYSTSRSVAATLSLLQASTPIPAISIALPPNPTKLDPTSKLTFHASTTVTAEHVSAFPSTPLSYSFSISPPPPSPSSAYNSPLSASFSAPSEPATLSAYLSLNANSLLPGTE